MDPAPDLQSRTVYPDSFVVEPSSGLHKQTFILLHGGGLESESFGKELLETPIPGHGNLPVRYPDARFIFPTATVQFSASLGMLNRQFFELGSVQNLDESDLVQVEGLRDSVLYIHRLLRSAIQDIGPRNVVLGGLSQGCAVSLMSLLLWEGPPIAAVLGMAGWLPFRKRIEDSWRAVGTAASADPELWRTMALSCLRTVLDLPAMSNDMPAACLDVPVFIGHGEADDDLPLSRAAPTHQLLPAMGLKVQLKHYDDVEHWYSGDMLRDFVSCLGEFRSPIS